MIMRTALSKTKPNVMTTKHKPDTANNKPQNAQQLKEHHNSEQEDKPKWPTKEKERRIHDNPPHPPNQINPSVVNSHSNEEPRKKTINHPAYQIRVNLWKKIHSISQREIQSNRRKGES